MELTDFRRLRNAIMSLDLNFINNSISELRDLLEGRGQPLELKHTVITEEGIYYVNHKTGMSTKVALYQAEQWLKSKVLEMRIVDEFGYQEPQALDIFSKYHLVRCNLLTHYERNNFDKTCRVLQRTDGGFYHRLRARINKEDFHQDIESQKLEICPNCLIKINSMLSDTPVFSKETFEPKLFFAAGFQATWRDRTKPSQGERALDDIHPKDLEEICRKRKEQVNYICDSCSTDLSSRSLRKFALVRYSDHLANDIGFIRLQCLCVNCFAHTPEGESMKNSEDYNEYMKVQSRPSA